jgi:hypothetical protein
MERSEASDSAAGDVAMWSLSAEVIVTEGRGRLHFIGFLDSIRAARRIGREFERKLNCRAEIRLVQRESTADLAIWHLHLERTGDDLHISVIARQADECEARGIPEKSLVLKPGNHVVVEVYRDRESWSWEGRDHLPDTGRADHLGDLDRIVALADTSSLPVEKLLAIPPGSRLGHCESDCAELEIGRAGSGASAPRTTVIVPLVSIDEWRGRLRNQGFTILGENGVDAGEPIWIRQNQPDEWTSAGIVWGSRILR